MKSCCQSCYTDAKDAKDATVYCSKLILALFSVRLTEKEKKTGDIFPIRRLNIARTVDTELK